MSDNLFQPQIIEKTSYLIHLLSIVLNKDWQQAATVYSS